MCARTSRPGSRAASTLVLLVLLACDPPSVGRSTHDTLLPRSGQEETRRDPVADATLGDASLVVLADGTLELRDRHGRLRARVFDPGARFPDVLELSKVPMGRSKPHPEISVRLAGLSDRLTRQGRERREQEALEAKGLTESARVLAAIAEAAEITEQRLAALDGELEALWADASKPASERRRLLFERWDECEEAPGDVLDRAAKGISETDAERGRGGEELRRRIEAFVRQVAPAGSPQAFDAAELSRLNARRSSRQRFDPYAPPRDAAGDDPAASGVVAR